IETSTNSGSCPLFGAAGRPLPLPASDRLTIIGVLSAVKVAPRRGRLPGPAARQWHLCDRQGRRGRRGQRQRHSFALPDALLPVRTRTSTFASSSRRRSLQAVLKWTPASAPAVLQPRKNVPDPASSCSS